MENKNKFLKILVENNGRLNEIDLGEKIGLNENETRVLIAQLLSENRIEYTENGTCNYRPTKTSKKRIKK